MNSGKKTSLDHLGFWQCFHIRLTVLYGGTVLLTLLVMAFVFYQLVMASEIDGLKQRLLAIATSLSKGVDTERMAEIPIDGEKITPFHAVLLEKFGYVVNSDPDIDSIYILRPTNEPTKLRFLVDYAKEGGYGKPGEVYFAGDVPTMLKGFEGAVVEDEPVVDKFGLSLSGYAPVRDDKGRAIGVLGVDVMVDRLVLLQEKVMWVTLAVFGAASVLVGLLSFFVSRSIRAPLNELISATSAIAQGEYDAQIAFSRTDEFGVLGQCFGGMAKELKERQLIKDTFGRYVSEDVAKALLQSGNVPLLGGEERVVTIMFCDIRDYTTISEKMSPVQMIEMLNRYLGEMNDIIDEHKGCVIEFLGDGILAVFGAPEYYTDHAESAISCALAMRERLDGLNKAWDESGLAVLWKQAGIDKLSARIGLHTGPVVAGNLGSSSRMKYAVIGDSVNVAARLEVLNKELGTSILLSEDVRSYLSRELVARMKDEGVFSVKGRQQSIPVFSI